MKYKLIKTYPGSPPLNYIAEMQPGTNMYFYNGLQIVEIHNHPEFWQPETEQENKLEEEVYQIIFDNVDIRGICLEDYKSNFKNSDLFLKLYELFNR